MNILLSASSLIFPLVTFPYVSRVLEKDGVGSIAYATSVVAYFCMLATLGIPSYGIRACAGVRDDKLKLSRTVHELMMLNSITAAVSLLLFLPVFLLSDNKAVLAVCAVAIILDSIGVLWLYRALEKYTFITLCSLACKTVSLLLMFFTVKDPTDTVMYAALTVIATFGVNAFSFLRLGKHIVIKPLGQYDIKQHIKPVLVFFATSVAISVYTNLDTVMLGVIKTDADVGIYSAAIKIKLVLTTVVTSLSAVVLPRLSAYLADGKRDEFKELLNKISQFVFSLALPLTVFFMMYAKDTVLLLSGDGFLPAVTPALILFPTVLIVSLSNVTGILTLVPLGREKSVMTSVFVGAAVDFVLNLLLIPRFSYIGAAASTLVAEVFVLVIQLIFLKKERPRIHPVRPLISTAVGVVICYFTDIGNPFLNLVVGFLIFVSVSIPYEKIKSRVI